MSLPEDPRVLFAAERTLLAWSRSALALMAFGFALERSGLLMGVFAPEKAVAEGSPARWLGLAFIVLGAVAAVAAIPIYRRVVRSQTTAEGAPLPFRLQAGVVLNIVIACMGLALAALLAFDFR
ncbi:YidH family protein [Haliangium ochraceum]|uniref:DUF202 domain-containing protein n=1 Tax=Haliangium ochraceum (strain DSM 14365 / JCM 11303 / SMP-2) TaxID=502025 RepID=D0LH41_HALO1|nr:DUF202 domain-containing protein [Haliangium ochraceum]ACY18186.1 protein of unknown function DUF202 [Haliangium ochraceum DSM 14365]